jgi:hypothetical protein
MTKSHYDLLLDSVSVMLRNTLVLESILKYPMRIFHVEHQTTPGWTLDGQAKLFAPLAAESLPSLDDQELAGLSHTAVEFANDFQSREPGLRGPGTAGNDAICK